MMRFSCSEFRAHVSGEARRGVTIIEAVLSVLIASIVLVAALSTLGAAARTRQVFSGHHLGSTLAQELMGEILQTYYVDPDVVPPLPDTGPPAMPTAPLGIDVGEQGISRATWDDIDDFHGWSSSPPRTRDDQVLSEYHGWTRSVQIRRLDPATLDALSLNADDQGLREVEVTVTSPGGIVTVLTALRAYLPALEQPPTLDTTYIRAAGIALQLSADPSTRAIAETEILNHRPPLLGATP